MWNEEIVFCGVSCIRREPKPRATQTIDVASTTVEKLSVFGGKKGIERFLGITRICKKSEILFPTS